MATDPPSPPPAADFAQSMSASWPGTRALAGAALVSLALHALLLAWPQAPRREALLSPPPGVWSVTLAPPAPEPLPASEPSPEPVAENPAAAVPAKPVATAPDGGPATADAPPPSAAGRRLDLRLPDAPTFAPERQNTAGATIFDPRLRERMEQQLRDQRARRGGNVRSEISSWVAQNGREQVIDGERCSEILPAFDHQSTAVMTLPGRCAWVKSQAERFGDALDERLRKRR